nr:unnamed protein product [Callosobruchus analis]
MLTIEEQGHYYRVTEKYGSTFAGPCDYKVKLIAQCLINIDEAEILDIIKKMPKRVLQGWMEYPLRPPEQKKYAELVGHRLQINNDFYTLEDLENGSPSANQSLNEPNRLHRHHGAPATTTPTVSQTFFEDSLSNFALKTPKNQLF